MSRLVSGRHVALALGGTPKRSLSVLYEARTKEFVRATQATQPTGFLGEVPRARGYAVLDTMMGTRSRRAVDSGQHGLCAGLCATIFRGPVVSRRRARTLALRRGPCRVLFVGCASSHDSLRGLRSKSLRQAARSPPRNIVAHAGLPGDRARAEPCKNSRHIPGFSYAPRRLHTA